jgi:outer membrane protein OmpA-like peptidoglycan-associated protein
LHGIQDAAGVTRHAPLEWKEIDMTRRLGFVIVCGSFTLLSAACATKSFVQEQLSETETRVTHLLNATETLLTNRDQAQETKLRETVDRAASSREKIDEVAGLASDAKTRADSAAVAAGDARTRADSAVVAARDTEARLAQRLADRNKYRLWETRVIYFDSDRTEIRSVDIKALEDLAKALRADANAILELQGFADPRGSDRYNNELARERVEAVVRYLVRHHGIEPRQLQAVTMGKAELGTGDKPSTEALAEARRVDIRLLAPWSSWEDTQAQIDQSDEAGAASPPTSIEADRSAMQKIAPHDGLKEDGPGTTWLEIMKTISPQDLGATD